MQLDQTSSLFDLDEIVWAKVIGYPYWPGQISCIYDKINHNGQKYHEYVVNFFEDVSHAILREKCLLKYVQNYQECSSSKYKGLKNAIMQADSIFKDRQKKQINNTDNMAPMVINSDTQEYSNLHLYGDTQSEEHRMRVNSMRKGSSLHVAYEETEEEPIKKQIIFNEDSHNENSGDHRHKLNSAFTPVARHQQLPSPPQNQTHPIQQTAKYFRPIVLK